MHLVGTIFCLCRDAFSKAMCDAQLINYSSVNFRTV